MRSHATKWFLSVCVNSWIIKLHGPQTSQAQLLSTSSQFSPGRSPQTFAGLVAVSLTFTPSLPPPRPPPPPHGEEINSQCYGNVQKIWMEGWDGTCESSGRKGSLIQYRWWVGMEVGVREGEGPQAMAFVSSTRALALSFFSVTF